MNEEIWKDIPGYEGRYQASTHGRIRGLISGKILHPCIGSNGYYYVGLRKSPKSSNAKYQPVHHLIALTFLGERPDKAVICHGDGDKLNDSVDNLRYGSSRENHLDVYRQGGKYGKLTTEQAKDVKIRLANGETLSQIARDCSVTPSAIYYIAKGVRFSWLDA